MGGGRLKGWVDGVGGGTERERERECVDGQYKFWILVLDGVHFLLFT